MTAQSVACFLLVLTACHQTMNDPVPTTTTARDQGQATDPVSEDLPVGADLAVSDVDADEAADMRRSLGEVWNTYYWLAPENEHPGAKTVELLDTACEPVATVSEDYADAICIEGSGRLDDGRVLNYASLCDCGRPCSGGSIICWKALDPATHPWGEGAFGNALVPIRSVAVDPDFVPLRTPIYIAEFDGVELPTVGGVDGFTHDGCFRADDVGGAIDGNHIDVFAGTTAMWRHLESVFPTRTTLDAYLGATKCAYLEL